MSEESRGQYAFQFSILHFILVILLPFVLLLISGCVIQDITLPKEEPFDVQQKDRIVAEAYGARRFTDIKAGDWVWTDFTQQIMGQNPILTGQHDVLVDTLIDRGSTLYLKLIQREIEIKSDGSQIENRYVDELEIQKDETATNLSTALRSLKVQPAGREGTECSRVGGCSLFSARRRLPSGCQVTFSALKVNKFTSPPPDRVRLAPTCGGVPGCRLNVTSIEYDEIYRDSGPDRRRFHCELQLSPEAPYMGVLIKRCLSTLAEIPGGQKIPYRSCADVVNFEFGR